MIFFVPIRKILTEILPFRGVKQPGIKASKTQVFENQFILLIKKLRKNLFSSI